jgi:hypothetical protein
MQIVCTKKKDTYIFQCKCLIIRASYRLRCLGVSSLVRNAVRTNLATLKKLHWEVHLKMGTHYK